MASSSSPIAVEGRYAFYDRIASGGMATVYLGRMVGQVGFAKVVALKRLHPHLAVDPEFVAMFLDEARMAARISHPNVVSTLDVVSDAEPPFLVMDYVDGESLSHLIKAARNEGQLIDPAIASAILSGALYGLHAAHTASDERGQGLGLVHRDVSPQNILVGRDGVPRVLDFGVAKATHRIASTEAGKMKGKFSYMAPEQVRNEPVDARADVFAAGVCLWETLTGHLLFAAKDPGGTIARVLELPIPAPSTLASGVSPALDAVVLRALERDIGSRYASAREFAAALEDATAPAIPRKVGAWVEHHAGEMLSERASRLAEIGGGIEPLDVGQVRNSLIDSSGEKLPKTVGLGPLGTERGGGSGQSSNVSEVLAVTHGDPLSAARANPRLTRIAIVSVALALGSVVVLALALSSSPTRSSPSSGVTPLPPAQPVTPAAEPDATPEVNDAQAPPPPLATSSVPPAEAPAPTRKSAPNVRPPRANCTPPYTIDEKGIKRFKPQCF